jgi:hypothetical protein
MKVISYSDVHALKDSLIQVLQDALEPAYDAKRGATSLSSLYNFAKSCHNIPLPLMAMGMQHAVIAVSPAPCI